MKGTEFYDEKLKRYVDMPITDVLQMTTRGSPWFWCTTASSCMSLSLGTTWELVAGTTHSRQNALDYMTWTFFFRRLAQNPSYYGMEDTEVDRLNSFLSGLVGKAPDQM